jgi:hypothetical protein
VKSEEYRQYIASADWQQRRKQFLRPWTFCWGCMMPRWLAKIAYGQDINVHHKSYANLGNERPTDVTTLCRRCHEIETFGRSELTAPPSAKCEVCRMDHWNPYSDYCDRCYPLIQSVWMPRGILLRKSGDEEIWKGLLRQIADDVGIDATVEALAEAEEISRRHQERMKEEPEPVRQ